MTLPSPPSTRFEPPLTRYEPPLTRYEPPLTLYEAPLTWLSRDVHRYDLELKDEAKDPYHGLYNSVDVLCN